MIASYGIIRICVSCVPPQCPRVTLILKSFVKFAHEFLISWFETSVVGWFYVSCPASRIKCPWNVLYSFSGVLARVMGTFRERTNLCWFYTLFHSLKHWSKRILWRKVLHIMELEGPCVMTSLNNDCSSKIWKELTW